MGLKELDKYDKEIALRKFNKRKKQFEKNVASVILKKVVILEKNMFEKYGQKITNIERDTAIRDFYKRLIEMIDKKTGLSPKHAEIMPSENMRDHLLNDLVAERIYKKIEKLRPKYIKKLHVKEKEEQLKKEHEKEHKIQEKREKLRKSIYEIVKNISIVFGQFRMGLYRDHIYKNLLWWVGNLRNDIKSLAELDLSPSEYKDMLSFKNFNLERFLSNDPKIDKFYSYYDDVCYDSHGDNIDYLYKLNLGLGWSRKEDYICALELVNRIERSAKELIKDYTPAVSKKIIEIRLPQEPKPIILKCIECRWETTENINLCEMCGGKLENKAINDEELRKIE